MGRHIRDDRQRKAFTGLSQAQCAQRLSVFSALSQATQQNTYEAGVAGVESGTRRRQPGGGSKGTLPTMADQLLCVLDDSQTSPPFAVLGTPGAMVRSKAHETLHKFSPIFSKTLGH
jgi:hypothetical protein